jgi:hypothetical protein
MILSGHYGNIIGFGNMCTLLYRKNASFIICQNIVIDGGTINAKE